MKNHNKMKPHVNNITGHYRNTGNGWYNIKDNSADCHTKTYCQMTPLTGCSGGGWTLVMKIDGNKVCKIKGT